MKLNENFVLRKVAGTWTVLPLGQSSIDFNGMLTLNDSGVMLWDLLEKGADEGSLVDALTNAYDVDSQQSREDLRTFLDVLTRAGCIER